MAATIEISIPDALVKVFENDSGDLSSRAIEALVAQAYRTGKITHAQAAEILGLDRWQTDAFLKSEHANRATESQEFTDDLARLRQMKN